MSVLIENEQGWLISHQAFLDNLYENCFEEDIRINMKFRNDFFRINTPLLMDSAALKRSQNSGKVEKKKRIKKKKDSGFHHLQAKPVVKSVTDILCEEGRNRGYLQDSEVSATEWFENNSAARSSAKEMNCKCYCSRIPLQSLELQNSTFQIFLQEYDSMLIGLKPTIIIEIPIPEAWNHFLKEDLKDICDECLKFKSSVNQYEHFENDDQYSVIKTIGKSKYVMPPYSSCYVGDVRNILSVTDTRYDVVLLDPPWKNKSVKRKKGYMTLTNDDLLYVPVHQLTKPGSLVIVWATNNENQITFVKEKLFEAWNVKYCVTWYWAKITQKGTLVHQVDSHQKKPYENIIFGRVWCDKNTTDSVFNIPEPNKVIVSIPSSIHSHKPPLSEILKPYIPEDAKCLELFARYLLPRWISCGNEVLKLQSLQLFENVKCLVN